MSFKISIRLLAGVFMLLWMMLPKTVEAGAPLLLGIFDQDTTVRGQDSLPFPLNDRRGDGLSVQTYNPFDQFKPSSQTDSVVYDPSTRRYVVYELIGGRYFRNPVTYSFDQYWAMRNRQMEQDYFQKRTNATSILNRGKLLKPKLSFSDRLFNRIFGTGRIEISPQGNVDITAGYQGQKIDNPTLPERARRNGGLDFQMNAQMNVNANIGDKLKFPINYNTLANFDLDNQLKLDYTGQDDEILKRFEAGNINFASKGTLIPGAQQLFGVKTQLQFGKLFLTGVVASQKSQRQNVNLQGGAAATPFEVKADEYEENRHFLISQYFKDNYNKVMGNLPALNAQVQILRMEVWVTNRNGTTTDTRDVVGLADLGELRPYLQPPLVNVLTTQDVPENRTNDLLINILSRAEARNSSLVYTNLVGLGLTPVQDFEKTFARKLDSTMYNYNRQLGMLSLNQPLLPDEVLGVAFQYTYRGRVYQVGEFSQDVPPDSTSASQKVLFLKLLKATSQRTELPIWRLMMKNVYTIGYGTLSPTDFKLDVLYQEPGLGSKRYLPFGDKNQGSPIISLINLDRLNSQNDPQPDGVFDFVEGFTVNSTFSRIVFPVLEPFGRDLAPQVFNVVPPNVKDTLFYALYDSIKAVAQQYPSLNRFILKGTAKTSGSSDISIGYNIPKGSVRVTAGGRTLQEGVDYDINYDLGTIKMTNQAILNAGLPVQVNFENNASFGLQQRNFLAMRLDYMAKNTMKEQLSFGGTIVRLGERPFFTKVNYNEDPIRNTMYGFDMNYRKDVPRLTKILDKLPIYSTTAPSSINAFVEAAYLQPGHAPQIGRGSNGVIYIDDFEGSRSGIDLRFPLISWSMASTPQFATDRAGNELFPEAVLNNNVDYGKSRAKLAWYQIEQALQQPNGNNNPIRNLNELSDPRVRQIFQKEIFPQRTTGFGEGQLVTFDLAYYPKEKGPYNFETSTTELNSDGTFRNPQKKFGGLMRSIDQIDFETGNIEFIEFWMQDPFILPQYSGSSGGKLYFNLGNVSEDILKDGKRFYENGLPTPNAPSPFDTSVWGKVPRNPIQVTNAFSNNPSDRAYQDVGLDGLTNEDEISYRANYLADLSTNFGTSSLVYQKAISDPSGDNYKNYRDASFSGSDGILKRYKNFSCPDGNSPIAGGEFSSAATMNPDAEDLNRDNTMGESENYFQYIVDIKPNDLPGSNPYIVDKKVVNIRLPNGLSRDEAWYQFRIPVGSYERKVGNIRDFKSIRFIRMFLTDFEDSVVLRFGTLQLVRNMWRKFQYKLDQTGITSPFQGTPFSVGAVNIEENDRRTPLPYRTPREIQRVQTISNNGVNLLMNEQAMSLNFAAMRKGDGVAVFQTFANRDLRQFKKLQMYVHTEQAESPSNSFRNKDLTAVIRIGTDFINNYYEVRIPLMVTPLNLNINPESPEYNDSLWYPANSLNLDMDKLTKIKQARNVSSTPLGQIFSELQSNGQTYSVIGNPNLAEVRGILLGVENTNSSNNAFGQIWVNELRLSSINEQGGMAAIGRIDATLSDLGTLSVSANMHTRGFGTLEQRVNERFRDDFLQFDVSANVELGKLLPQSTGLSIPVFASYSQTTSMPEYDPYDMDIKLKDKIRSSPKSMRDSIRNIAVDFTSTKTLNFTNVRKNRNNEKTPRVYDVENVDVSYSYTKTETHTPLIEMNEVTKHRGAIGYNYAPPSRYVEPLKGFMKKSKSKWLAPIREVNFSYLPAQLSFRADLTRQFGAIRPRQIGEAKYVIPETYDKYFTMQRDYVMRWNFTRSLNFDYTATNNSRVDEPNGRINTKVKRDSIWKNVFRGGRNTLFNQTANFSYTVPTTKIPVLDWTTINLKYQASYKWIGASRLATNLGNFLENGQQKEATLQLDFNKIYQMSKWLKQLDQPSDKENRERWRNRITRIKDTIVTKSGKRIVKKKRIVDKSAMPYVSPGMKVLGKLLTSMKQGNISISENANTRLPGYTDSTRFFGQNFASLNPGFDFIAGYQPDTNWLNEKSRRGMITKDSTFNALFQQNYDQKIMATAQLEPIRDLNITVNISKSFTKNYSETFRYIDTTLNGTNPTFKHLNPLAGGGFDVSYVAFKTLFGNFDPNRVSETFRTFQNNRVVLSRRLGQLNPYSAAQGAGGDGFYYGYGRYAVDVLIPSFIAAYTGQDPNKVALVKQSNPTLRTNPFSAIIPKPNWKIDYTGLGKIPALSNIFTALTLTHGYTCNLSMNGFTSALLYQDVSRYGYPSFYDTASKNFIPYFLIPNITIQEQFSPVGGIDMMFVNQVQAKIEYSKTRQLSMSLNDYQLSEVRSTELVLGAGYRKKGLKLLAGLKLPSFLSKNNSAQLDNEINFRIDIRIRDNVTANSRLDQETNFATNGSKDVTLSPSIDYFLSNKVNVKLFFDQRKTKPYISSSAPTTNTRAGIQIRISLSP